METDDRTAVDPAAEEEIKEIKPCMSCMAPNPVLADICVDCGQPFGGGNVLTPMGTVRAEVNMWSGVLPGQKEERRPTKLKLVVVWIILLPLLAMSVGFAFQQIYIREGLLSFVVFWVSIAVSWFSISGLYRVTRDYLRPQNAEGSEGVEDLP